MLNILNLCCWCGHYVLDGASLSAGPPPSVYKRRKVSARVTGTVQSSSGSAYVLEFETQGGSHRLQYPKPSRGKSFEVGQTVALFYDPDDLDKMYVEGDKAMLGARDLYYALGAALLVLMFGLMGGQA